MSARRPGIKVSYKGRPLGAAKPAELPLSMPAAQYLKLANPEPLEGKGQEKCVRWFRSRGFAEGVKILAVKGEVANNFRGAEPTEAEKLRVKLWMLAMERQGADKGRLDTVTLWRPGRAGWMELKREGATLSSLEPEQEDMILDLHGLGFPVALAHAVPEEMEEVYDLWGVPLRERVPPWAKAPPRTAKVRWPLEGDKLAAEIRALRAKRAIRNTAKLTKEKTMDPPTYE